MGLRVLALTSAGLAFAASFCVLAVGQVFIVEKLGLLNVPVGILVVVASLVGSVPTFRAVHNWVVLRWSNEPNPFVYDEWRPGKFWDVF
jgi:hypothetical protein